MTIFWTETRTEVVLNTWKTFSTAFFRLKRIILVFSIFTLYIFPTVIFRLSIFILLVLALYISFPAQLIRRAILLIFVFIIYPVAVLLIRKFWKFYHDRQKKDADDKIKALEKQKEEILETVMEKVSFFKLKWGASSRWSSLYCFVRNWPFYFRNHTTKHVKYWRNSLQTCIKKIKKSPNPFR